MNVTLFVNSHVDRRATDSTTKWTSAIATPITFDQRDTLKIQVDQVDFPNTCYSFPYHSYKFWFIRNVGTTDDLTSISIDYTRNWNNGTELVEHLNALTSAAGLAALTFSYDTNKGKLTITNGLAAPISIISSYRFIENDAIYAQIEYECTDRLGFTADYRGVTIAAAGTYEAPSILRLLRTSCYYLTCNLPSAKMRQAQVPTYKEQPNIIARISASNWQTVSQLPYASSVYYTVAAPSTLSSIEFSVLDDELYEVSDLNGAPITFALKLLIA